MPIEITEVPRGARLWGIDAAASASANVLAWRLMMDELVAAGGGVVVLPPGTYQANAELEIPEGIEVRGDGRRTTVIQLTANLSSPNVFVKVRSRATLRDLTVDCNGNQGNGVAIFEAVDALVDNVEVRNCIDYGVWIIDFGGQQDLDPVVVPQGTTGATTYGYVVAARDAGGVIRASAEVQIATGNATLDGTNFNNVSWTEIRDATAYDVYRATGGGTQGLIGTVTAGTLELDDTGLAGDSAPAPSELHAEVQYGRSRVTNCISEARDCFEVFYAHGVDFVNCEAVGTVGIAGTATDGSTGFNQRDSSYGINYTNCRSRGTFDSAGMKITNNDDKVLLDARTTVVACHLANDYDADDRYCLYTLDVAGVEVEKTFLRAYNACSGLRVGVSVATYLDLRSTYDVNVDCAGAGHALKHARGCNVTYRGRYRSAESTRVIYLGTNGSLSNGVVFEGADLVFDTSGSSARYIQFNDCKNTHFSRCRLLGDGVNKFFCNLGGGSACPGVRWSDCDADGVHIQFLDNAWSVVDSMFTNRVDATLGGARYVNADGGNHEYTELRGNRYVLEGATTPPTGFVVNDSASNESIANNFQVAY